MIAKLSAFERLASRANTHTWDAPLGLHNECWSWTGSRDSKGYGFISVNGRTRRVHIVAWELATGRKLRKGYTLQHRCRNTSCWRPSHVEVMSRSRNTADGNRNNPRSTEKARAMLRMARNGTSPAQRIIDATNEAAARIMADGRAESMPDAEREILREVMR